MAPRYSAEYNSVLAHTHMAPKKGRLLYIMENFELAILAVLFLVLGFVNGRILKKMNKKECSYHSWQSGDGPKYHHVCSECGKSTLDIR